MGAVRQPSGQLTVVTTFLCRQLGGDHVGGLVETATERLDVEAGAHLRQDVLERVAHRLKVASLDSVTSDVLVGEVIKVLCENHRIGSQVEDRVETVGNSYQVGAPFTARGVINVDSLEEVLSLRVAVEDVVEDSLSDGDAAISEGGSPEVLPEELQFLPVLG